MKKKNIGIILPENLIGIEVGTEPYDYKERKDLIPGNVDYSHAAGPWCIEREGYSGYEKEALLVRDCFKRYGGTFLGEIGLDYHWMYGTKEEQIKLFETQLDLSEELRVPVIIHSRDADEDLVSIIKKRSFPYSGIMHCFSSSYDIAKAALDKGLYISFAGNVTYKSNNLIQQAAKYVPSDRILYETDSPYLAPVPMRYKPCNPCYSDYTSSFLADLRNKEADEFRSEAISNFKRLRSISEGTLKAARDYS